MSELLLEGDHHIQSSEKITNARFLEKYWEEMYKTAEYMLTMLNAVFSGQIEVTGLNEPIAKDGLSRLVLLAQGLKNIHEGRIALIDPSILNLGSPRPSDFIVIPKPKVKRSFWDIMMGKNVPIEELESSPYTVDFDLGINDRTASGTVCAILVNRKYPSINSVPINRTNPDRPVLAGDINPKHVEQILLSSSQAIEATICAQLNLNDPMLIHGTEFDKALKWVYVGEKNESE